MTSCVPTIILIGRVGGGRKENFDRKEKSKVTQFGGHNRHILKDAWL
jgi:hypothetical protein